MKKLCLVLTALLLCVAPACAFAAEPAAEELPAFKSFDELLEKVTSGINYYYGPFNDAIMAAPQPAPAESADSGASGDFSQTNVQKQGVDEGDVIKTDGRYIYTLSDNRVFIIKADGADMEQAAVIGAEERLFFSEIYVAGDRLVLCGTLQKEFPLPQIPEEPAGAGADSSVTPGAGVPDLRHWYFPRVYYRTYTVYQIYDIKDRANPEPLQRFEVSGRNLATRVIDDTLYYATSHDVNIALPWNAYSEAGIEPQAEWLVPSWDSGAESGEIYMPAETIRYFPDSDGAGFLMLGAVNLSGLDEPEPQAYYGIGDNFYMDAEHILVACHTRGDWTRPQTRVYKYTLTGDGVVYTASAPVTGYIINQYAMDIHGGNVRVATSDNNGGNNVYVFGEKMEPLGSTEAFAKGETVRSVRFMGDMAYVVTFRNTDPLFCIDLTNPASPVILGELKIPGFSQYLHPIGNGLLVGFGRDTVETEWGGFNEIGFKISLFDVSNPKDPQEVSVLTYSNEEFYSDTFNNPRSILVDPARARFAFSAIGQDFDDFDPTVPDNDFKAFLEKGAYIWYGVIVADVADGRLVERKVVEHGRLTYGEAGKMAEGYYYFYNPLNQYNIRAVYIGDTFYTVGAGGVAAWDYGSFEALGSLRFTEETEE